jgi:hypothetical protein
VYHTQYVIQIVYHTQYVTQNTAPTVHVDFNGMSGPYGAPTREILIAQYRLCVVIIDGVEAVLKACAMIEETLS